MIGFALLAVLLAPFPGAGSLKYAHDHFSSWSLDKAVQILNASPWARQETLTRVIGGVGSGISGEKEIYNTFYIRFLSARPIREAFARIQQIQSGYDRMPAEEKRSFDRAHLANLDMDLSRWIVVSVGFRSNDPNEESDVRRFFQSQTASTLKNRVYLSTPICPQLELSAYFPPREESIGAKFVFHRERNGSPVLNAQCGYVALELLDIMGANSRLRSVFPVKPMIVGDELVF
jgi:hypothetical protein